MEVLIITILDELIVQNQSIILCGWTEKESGGVERDKRGRWLNEFD